MATLSQNSSVQILGEKIVFMQSDIKLKVTIKNHCDLEKEEIIHANFLNVVPCLNLSIQSPLIFLYFCENLQAFFVLSNPTIENLILLKNSNRALLTRNYNEKIHVFFLISSNFTIYFLEIIIYEKSNKFKSVDI